MRAERKERPSASVNGGLNAQDSGGQGSWIWFSKSATPGFGSLLRAQPVCQFGRNASWFSLGVSREAASLTLGYLCRRDGS